MSSNSLNRAPSSNRCTNQHAAICNPEALPPVSQSSTTTTASTSSPDSLNPSPDDPSWLVSIRNLNRTGAVLRPSNLSLVHELERRRQTDSSGGVTLSPRHIRRPVVGSSRPSYHREISSNTQRRGFLSHQTSDVSARSFASDEGAQERRLSAGRVSGFEGGFSSSHHRSASPLQHTASAAAVTTARLAAQRDKLLAQQQLAAGPGMRRTLPPPTRYQRCGSDGSRTSANTSDVAPTYQHTTSSSHSPYTMPHAPLHQSMPPPRQGSYASATMSPNYALVSHVASSSFRGPGRNDYSSANSYATTSMPGAYYQPGLGSSSTHTTNGFRSAQYPNQLSSGSSYHSRSHFATPPPPPPPPQPVVDPPERMVEISPDVYVRLRGADETWACIEQDFYMPAVCFGCSAELCCIQDADFVLCPTCRVVSPMNGIVDVDHCEGGVGLGFTFEELMKWQAEIVSARQQQQRQMHLHQKAPSRSSSRLGVMAYS